MAPKLAGRLTPLGLFQRARLLLDTPADIPLALKIGYFIYRTPTALAGLTLPGFLSRVQSAPRPAARDLRAATEKIVRIREAWLRRSFLRTHDTCYVRALTLYRFLDPGGRNVRIHFGVEERANATERLRGHAWVTVDGQLLE
ncbi:MAG: lasso peptide biosynthesis B2 protein, partial [Candidatus Eremiobacteraeota bacterium]|nr:lasso peptide biosynthesis B2 protein [Candidatus Eremiobacteraeota bacterium]